MVPPSPSQARGVEKATLHRHGRRLTGVVYVPSRHPLYTLRLRACLPRDLTFDAVRVNGYRRPIDRRTGTIGLAGLSGMLDVVAVLRRT
jgi:hypothetical protein